MVVFTPRGLKVRLPVEYVFALIARLWTVDPRTDAFRVLKTCESIELVPSTLAFLAGLVVVLAADLSPAWLLVIMPGARIAGATLTRLGLFVVIRPLGLLALARLMSYVSGYGLFHLIAAVMMYLYSGWTGAGFWFGGALAAVVAAAVAEWISFAVFYKHTAVGREMLANGQVLTSSEVSFINAFRLHADNVGVSRDLDLNPEEMDSQLEQADWRLCLQDMARKWPVMAKRMLTAAA